MLSVGIISGLIAMLCWGIADFLVAVTIRKVGSLKAMFWGNLIGLFPLIFVVIFFFNQLFITVNELILLLIAGAIMLVATISFYKAYEIGEVSVVTPIATSASLVTVLLAVLILGEQLSLLNIISIIIVSLGIILVSTDFKKLKHIHTVKGVKEAVITMILWGVYIFIIKVLSSTMSLINLSVFSFLLINSYLMVYPLIKKVSINLKDLKKDKIYMIFIANSLLFLFAWVAFNYGIKHDLISLVAPVSSLSPSITVILALIFYKEKLVLNQKLGILTILLGLFLISL